MPAPPPFGRAEWLGFPRDSFRLRKKHSSSPAQARRRRRRSTERAGLAGRSKSRTVELTAECREPLPHKRPTTSAAARRHTNGPAPTGGPPPPPAPSRELKF